MLAKLDEPLKQLLDQNPQDVARAKAGIRNYLEHLLHRATGGGAAGGGGAAYDGGAAGGSDAASSGDASGGDDAGIGLVRSLTKEGLSPDKAQAVAELVSKVLSGAQ